VSRIQKDLLLLGSIPFDTVDQVFRVCSEYVGNYIVAIPDGEVGDRLAWVGYLARRYYNTHPDVEISDPGDGSWSRRLPSTQAAQFRFLRLKPGIKKIAFKELGYAESAKGSYALFTRLRNEGVIPADVRFQVCVPLTNSAMGWVFNRQQDWPIIGAAIEETLRSELREILAAIPAKDLMIQWDVCWEVLDAENYFSYSHGTDKMAFNTSSVNRLGMDKIPDDVWMGYHMCYGTIGGWPMVKPKDISIVVDFANTFVANTPRRVDYVHLPVPRKAFSNEYFAPLDRLKIGNTKVFLGLIHDSELDLTDFHRRRAVAQRHLSSFGVASVCGYGRCSREELIKALETHREIGRELSSSSNVASAS
jgi:hypothetical protein